MKFEIIVKDKISEWKEIYQYANIKTSEDIQKWIDDMLDEFNKERPDLYREIIGFAILSEELHHDWIKENLYSMGIQKYFCSQCKCRGTRDMHQINVKLLAKYRRKYDPVLCKGFIE
jgi:hypothetical protein